MTKHMICLCGHGPEHHSLSNRWCRSMNCKCLEYQRAEGRRPIDGAFACDGYPCPECGNESILGFLYLDQWGNHQHTHYVCTFWGSPEDKSVYLDPKYDATLTRCGWHGWVIPVGDDEDG